MDYVIIKDEEGLEVDAYMVESQICIELDDRKSTRMYFEKDEVRNLVKRLQQLVGEI